MATKARQQYFADEVSLSKEKREFSIADEIQQKIDSIEEGAQVNKIETVKVNGTALVPDAYKAVNIDVPEVIDNLYTVDSDNALSAKQGKLLYDYIQNIASRGRFLSNWNSATGLPMTNPSESPYPYKSGDYFNVSNVATSGGTNYRPDGSSYVIGQASTVVETENVSVSDFYFYDGTNWLLLSNSGRQIAIDTSLSTTSTNPVENRVITNALNGKQETLIAGTNIQIAADGKTISATDTTYSAGANISINANNEISATDTKYTAGANVQISNQNVISATDTKYTAGTGINIDANNVISNTQTSAEWGNITGTLSDQTDLQNALDEKQDKLTAGTNIQIDSNTNTISATDTTYNAGTGIAILNGVDYSALQGPCSTGFHVPTLGEVNKTKTIMNSLGLDTFNGWVSNFFIPMAGFRYPRYGASQTMIGDGENRWTSTCQSGGRPYSVRVLGQSTLTIQIDYSYNASFGACVRPFYNGYVEPTASWIVLNGTLGGPGIFHNVTDGIISLNDGTNYVTMADKNLGATTVYNSGDTRSQANCGNTYQWGNNYGFSYSSTVQTSNTKVDASSYGPGNYYSSPTFIQTTASEDDWSNPSNTNLWGGDVGIVTINNVITNIGVTSVNGQTGDITIQTGGNYSAGTGINIDANNEISNTLPGPTIAATAPTGTEGALWYDTTNDVLMAYNGTAWKEAGTQMKVLSYGHSTWNDFITAYQKNGVVYCRASSNSDPSTGSQGRLAFMAYVNNASNPTEVEFQYYRSRSDHNSAANQLDEVYVYKLVPASGGTWTVTQRNTGAKAVAGTGIGLSFGNGNMTISADTTTLATKTDLNSKQDTLVSGTNIKTINNNSLLGSGDIALNDVKVSATAPSSPTEGMTWYDTTNDELKVYDGTNWKATGSEYNAGEGISIGSVVINGRQGPAPEGFHVPATTEWQGLKTIMDGLSLTTGDGWRINLHMPFAGYRNYSNASLYNQGSFGYYWSSSPNSVSSNDARSVLLGSSYVLESNYLNRAYGQSLRCFKDSYITPDSNWTVIQGTLGSAGIFWNQTEGLISITDGSTGYTIMDKNLGATTVYSDGDTLSEANCGKYYQRGNNYGFPRTGSVTTSSTQVDASAYGPNTNNGYYSSDTFITGNNDWSSVANDDLWGDTTGTYTQENVITNTGVLSVNGQTGDVTIDDNTKIFVVNEPALTSGGSISNVEPFKDICERLISNPKHIAYITNKRSIMPHELNNVGSVMQIISHSGQFLDENNWMFNFIYIGFPFAENKELFKYCGAIEIGDGTARVANITANKINFTPSNSGTAGQVLTKTSSNYEWKDASGGFELAPNSPLSPKYRWYGTQAQYDALAQYYTDEEGDTVYYTI